jgi:hypothetical protein
MKKIALISIILFLSNIAQGQTSQELTEKCKSGEQFSCITVYMQQELAKECESNIYSSCSAIGVRSQFIDKDIVNALNFYRKGCNGGYLEACNLLGELHEDKTTIAHSYFDAYETYKINCQNNHLKSCTKQAILLKNGKGTRLDKKLAMSLFEKACNGNEVEGCFNLAIFYENGDGIKTNKTIATDLFGKSCDLKYADGCSNYARLIQLGNKPSSMNNQINDKNKKAETIYDDLLDCAAISYIGTAVFIPIEELNNISELPNDIKLLISEQQINFKTASDSFSMRAEFFRELYLFLSPNKNYTNKDYTDMIERKLVLIKTGIVQGKDYSEIYIKYNKCVKYIDEIKKIKKNVKENDLERSIVKFLNENKIINYKITDKQLLSMKIASINWKHSGFLTWNTLKGNLERKLN